MMSRRLRVLSSLLALGAALAAGSAPAAAQSLLAGRGLGYPLQPLDARARGLGGAGLGLPGVNYSLVNPAGAAGVPAPAIVATFQSDWLDSRLPGGESSASTARFPLLNAAFPIGERGALSVGYGAFLDRHSAVEVSDSLRIGGSNVGVTDRFATQGGVGRLRIGGAYALGERLAVGAAADLYSGVARDTVSRVFGTGAGITSSSFGADYTFRGLGGALGVRWAPSAALSLAAAASAGGKLEARRAEGTDSAFAGRSYTLPVTLHAGASGRVAPGALVALSGEWAGWSAADAEIPAAGGARDSWAVAGGVEWDDPAREGRASYPLRLGGRYAALPFRWGSAAQGNDFPMERAVTAGLGARLASGAAHADLAGERGWRGGTGATLDESYWRITLSLTLLGR